MTCPPELGLSCNGAAASGLYTERLLLACCSAAGALPP
jgi:hypothetical protein